MDDGVCVIVPTGPGQGWDVCEVNVVVFSVVLNQHSDSMLKQRRKRGGDRKKGLKNAALVGRGAREKNIA